MNNKVEVDPKLFITCRLCLEDLGVYQIVPEVKEQILFCFGINVDPFDSLPQLICKKCEEVLTNFATTKNFYIKKQNELLNKTKLVTTKSSTNIPVSQEQTGKAAPTENVEIKKNKETCFTKKRKPCISSSSSDSESETQSSYTHSNETTAKEVLDPWKNHIKQYVCRICDLRCLNINILMSHFNSRHFVLKKRYYNIFNRHCEVKLQKIDSQMNVLSTNNVIHSKNKIIKNQDPKYYILYTPDKNKIDEKCNNTSPNEAGILCSVKPDITKSNVSSDSSDDEFVIKRNRKRKLCSRSSNDTVVLDDGSRSNTSDNEKESLNVGTPIESECINIDDSSDNETRHSEDLLTPSTEIQKPEINKENVEPDLTTINDIITFCKNKYRKKRYHDNLLIKGNKSPTYIAGLLKCKILSIGRKIINKKKGVNCRPLLRFMEHKNLDITWMPRSHLYARCDSNVKILARLKNSAENQNNESSWTDYVATSNFVSGERSSISLISNTDDIRKDVSESNANEEAIQNNIPDDDDGGEDNQYFSVLEPIQADNINLVTTDSKKILNSNPVANPKQLPKKFTNETKGSKPISKKQIISNIEMIPQENNSNEHYMPIITSTTSLAVPMEKKIDDSIDAAQKPSSTNASQSEVPRIKVKSATELMSPETLHRMKEPIRVSCIVNPEKQMFSENDHVTTNVTLIPINTTALQFVDGMHVSTATFVPPEPCEKLDCVTLDTVELPNTNTNSPFQYFRTLLQVHNIVLLPTDDNLDSRFQCLIKFKVLYKQETNNQPVILCLSLYCSKNLFCLKIKDRNQENINMTNISANWQWEILKIYKGEVVVKLLENARKISQEVYEYTNTFLCLLNSINYIK